MESCDGRCCFLFLFTVIPFLVPFHDFLLLFSALAVASLVMGLITSDNSLIVDICIRKVDVEIRY